MIQFFAGGSELQHFMLCCAISVLSCAFHQGQECSQLQGRLLGSLISTRQEVETVEILEVIGRLHPQSPKKIQGLLPNMVPWCVPWCLWWVQHWSMFHFPRETNGQLSGQILDAAGDGPESFRTFESFEPFEPASARAQVGS